MLYNLLGGTGISVSRVCFGTLVLGPLQKDLPLSEGAGLLCYAADRGINFFDTAQLYETYVYIKELLKYKSDSVISTKSYAYDAKTAEDSLTQALKETGRDYIDVFMLHEQESELTVKGHYEAIEYYLRQKEKGVIRAIGLSTHHIAAVRAAVKYPELEIIHPIFNIGGLGIVDGTAADMETAVTQAHGAGKGIFTMKPLGGGHLIHSRLEAIGYLLSKPYIHSTAIGMQSAEEVDYNISAFGGEPISRELRDSTLRAGKKLHIADWCTGCGACVSRCATGALEIRAGKSAVDNARCVLCGYCASACKEACIKVF